MLIDLYNIDEMNEAINAPRVKVPTGLSDDEFLSWVKNLKDVDFSKYQSLEKAK